MKSNIYFFAFIFSVLGILEMGMLNPGPAKKYVCLPCGQSCDVTMHEKPGKCPACGMELVSEESVTFKNIDFAQLCQRIKENRDLVLLDVRSKEEFTNTLERGDSFGRFKNAVNVNIQELNDRISELEKFKDKEVIVYCSHSHRSPRASYFLTTHGFKHVKNLQGGVSTLQNDNSFDCLKDAYIAFPERK